jgi:hypothetical protein
MSLVMMNAFINDIVLILTGDHKKKRPVVVIYAGTTDLSGQCMPDR